MHQNKLSWKEAMFSHKRFGSTVQVGLYVEWRIDCGFYKASSGPNLWEFSLSSQKLVFPSLYWRITNHCHPTVEFCRYYFALSHNPGYISLHLVLCSGILHLYFHHCEAFCLEYMFLHLGLILFKYSAMDV